LNDAEMGNISATGVASASAWGCAIDATRKQAGLRHRRPYNRHVRVSEVGEFGLIRLLTQEFGITYPPPKSAAPPTGLEVGIGDDAVVTSAQTSATIWTTDTMVAGNHFTQGSAPWRDVGWKALAVNLSDIAAMGGVPQLALVTLALPSDFETGDAVELYRGLHDAVKAYDVILGGGDIVHSPVFSITVALSGLALEVNGRPALLRRDTAQAGDLVAVTGMLGAAAGGVRLLVQGPDFDAPAQPEAERELRMAQQRPQPRVAEGQTAVRTGLRCGMDVSDGLLQDLTHIATASGVAIRIEADRVPVSEDLSAVFPAEARDLAVTGGEDYELLLIGTEDVMSKFIGESQTKVTVIGRVEAEGEPAVTVVDERGRAIAFQRRGWDHLASS
jgi:thiamine-monophosphate kinase